MGAGPSAVFEYDSGVLTVQWALDRIPFAVVLFWASGQFKGLWTPRTLAGCRNALEILPGDSLYILLILYI